MFVCCKYKTMKNLSNEEEAGYIQITYTLFTFKDFPTLKFEVADTLFTVFRPF